MATQTDALQGYSIMEAAKICGLPESTLRYYESIGIIDPIKRDVSSKHRVYSEEDINLVVSVACLNATGLSITDMRTYLRNRKQGAAMAHEQIALLATQKQRLIDETRFLELRQRYVETKIAYWQAITAGNTDMASIISRQASEIAKDLKLSTELRT